MYNSMLYGKRHFFRNLSDMFDLVFLHFYVIIIINIIYSGERVNETEWCWFFVIQTFPLNGINTKKIPHKLKIWFLT